MFDKVSKVSLGLKNLLSLAKNHDRLLHAAIHSERLVKHCPSVDNVDELVKLVPSYDNSNTTSLDLGCGELPRNPFRARGLFGVDIRADLENSIKCANLALEPIPFDKDFFDFCTAYDFIEHMPRVVVHEGMTRLCFIELVNEIHRVLKNGGYFLHVTPAYPSKEAFQDPTHVNIITEDTFPFYFCQPELFAAKVGYGYTGNFELVGQVWVRASWLASLMKAVK